MPIYEFCCDNCGKIMELYRSFKKGPPSTIYCLSCHQKMHQVFNCNFILKGDDWPGKSLKERKYKAAEQREKTDQQFTEDKRNDRVVNEVTEVRRKGKKAKKQLQKDNPQKWHDYMNAMQKGHRAKK
jgi:putative FmdB family regulatory protein